MEFQREELDEILNIFQQESQEIISAMSDEIIFLEKNGNDSKTTMQLFRNAHSLKGSARMLGFEEIQNLAHKMEDVIGLVREEKMAVTSNVSAVLFQSLDFISDLINETVEKGQEAKDPKISEYIEKLEKIVIDFNNEEAQKDVLVDTNFENEGFVVNFNKIEKNILNILIAITYISQKKDYSNVLVISQNIEEFLGCLNESKKPEINKLKEELDKFNKIILNLENSTNKNCDWLDVNQEFNNLMTLVNELAKKINLKQQEYYDIVEKIFNKNKEIKEEQQARNQEQKQDNIKQIQPEIKSESELKSEEIPEVKVETIQDCPIAVQEKSDIDKLIDEFSKINDQQTDYSSFLELIKTCLTNEKNNNISSIYNFINEMVLDFQKENISLSYEIKLAFSEAFDAIKQNNIDLIKENKIKIDVIKTLSKFQRERKDNVPNKQFDIKLREQNQKEILNTLSNSEIKTLRVDSTKLDNLVGQIGELIVSKIKTNEQLVSVKKINNDMLDWQKDFLKMNYYIKYFEKKYLTEAKNQENKDFKKVLAYNKQLLMLAEVHNDKINLLLKEVGNLFKQLQESETKLNATANEIETMVKNMRILPLSTIFQLFPRMVHSIAKEKNKKIDLVINGADIAADKTIIEEIKIPLMHIIRNSIDHGIENTDERKRLGKNPIGQIEINASYKDNQVIIDVKDDGRGLDIEKIKAKALQKGLLTREELNSIPEEELTNLVFYPGFSTEDFVTDLSGRGLGLDIVNTKINQMQGRIDIFSQFNRGTIVRIVLPATVATKKVFIIQENEQLYAIETSVIKTIVRISPEEIFEKDNNNYYIYDGNVIAIYALSQVLNLKNKIKNVNKYTVMIIETENIIFGIIVEKLVSDQEIVHKKLAPPLYKIKHISGITTLASGDACLILSVGDIINTINSKIVKAKKLIKTSFTVERNNSKYTILVVDDSHTTRMLQNNILTKFGYNVVSATNPVVALEKLKQNKIDLIISDVEMPEMNGFEFILEARKNPDYVDTPVIMVSSRNPEDFEREIKECKVDTYIQKQKFKQEELGKEVSSLLVNRR